MSHKDLNIQFVLSEHSIKYVNVQVVLIQSSIKDLSIRFNWGIHINMNIPHSYRRRPWAGRIRAISE